MKATDTKPEFAGTEDDVREEIPSRPIRDPSLDGLLIGLEERLDQPYSSGAKIRVHTPPNAHTDPFPEEPVVAPNLTAPLSAVVAEKVQARGRVKPNEARELARPPRPLDPTYVLDREPTMTRRAWMIVGACGVVVVAALGVAVWAATAGQVDAPIATGTPAAEAPVTATLPSLPLAALPSAGVASALAVSPAPPGSASSSKATAPHAPRLPPGKPVAPSSTVPGEEPIDRGLK